MADEKSVLVTGATGQQGGAVARELLGKGYKVKALVRNPESPKARKLAAMGAELVQGDFDDAASLRNAMNNVWGVFAIQNTWEAGVEKEEEQGKRMAKIAKECGVRHYVYSSVQSCEKNTGIPHFDNKYRVEETVRQLGFPSYTILRPVFFMENWIAAWFKPGIDQGNVAIGVKPDTKIQMVTVADIGKYGLWAFENHDELNGRAIDIAGDELTPPQIASVISGIKGDDIGFFQVPIEEIRKFSDDFATMLEWFDNVGYNVDIDKSAEESGIKPTPFDEWAARVSW